MKQTPLHLIISRLNRLSADEQIDLLRKMVAVEKPYSVRRNELLSLLQGKVTKQLRKLAKAA